jgi:hypothetical protein
MFAQTASWRGGIAVALVVLSAFLGGFAFGLYSGSNKVFPYYSVRSVWRPIVAALKPAQHAGWKPVQVRWPGASPTEDVREIIARLEAVGYVSGSARPSGRDGVTTYDAEKTYRGFSFYVSGHGPEALLIDMDGHVRHRWRYAYERAWPGRSPPIGGDWWRRAHLFANGDVLAVTSGDGLMKIDKQSNLLWASHENFHHDLHVTDDELIYVLSREPKLVPWINERDLLLDDFISILDRDGRTLRKVSLLRALERSAYSGTLHHQHPVLADRPGDILHTNTLTVLDGSLSHRSRSSDGETCSFPSWFRVPLPSSTWTRRRWSGRCPASGEGSTSPSSWQTATC